MIRETDDHQTPRIAPCSPLVQQSMLMNYEVQKSPYRAATHRHLGSMEAVLERAHMQYWAEERHRGACEGMREAVRAEKDIARVSL